MGREQKKTRAWLWAWAVLALSLGLGWTALTASAQTPQPLGYGETVTGTVVDRLGDEWLFTGCISDVVTIRMESPDFGAFLELYGPTGRDSLTGASVEGPNAPATVDGFELPESGDYTIVAAGVSIQDRGAYTLSLEAAAEVASAAPSRRVAGALVEGATVTGTVTTRLGEEWSFRGCRDDAVTITMESPDFTPYLEILGPEGGPPVVEVTGDEGTATLEAVVLPASGAYIVLAAGDSIRARGAYTLTFATVERPAPPITATVTQTPTVTATATATKTPEAPSSGGSGSGGSGSGSGDQPVCIVVSSVLNLRAGPGTNYAPPIGALERDAVMIPLARNANASWLRVQVPGNGPTGWVSAAPQYVACNIAIASLPMGVIPPTYTPYPTPTYTPTYAPTYTPTYTPTPTGTYQTPTYTPTPTPTDYYTPTPTPTPTPTKPYGGGYPPMGLELQPPVAQLGDLTGKIMVPENYGPAQEPVFRNAFYFEAYVYDPNAGSYDGAGIDYVDFTIYTDGGAQVYDRREQTERYCSFGGGDPACPALGIGPGAGWPGTNTGLAPGRYRAKIKAKAQHNGRMGATWETYFWIESPNGGGNNGGGNNNGGNNVGLHAEIVQTGAGHNDDTVAGALVYRVEAYNPYVGDYDGAGIDYVILQIYYNGQKVHERRENNAAYCAFSGGEPDCNTWYFHDQGNQWPDGAPIASGAHTLRARVKGDDGQEKVLERQIMIDN